MASGPSFSVASPAPPVRRACVRSCAEQRRGDRGVAEVELLGRGNDEVGYLPQRRRFDPDLVLLGGDFVTWKRHIPLMADVLEADPAIVNGVMTGELRVDWPLAQKRKTAVVDQLVEGRQQRGSAGERLAELGRVHAPRAPDALDRRGFAGLADVHRLQRHDGALLPGDAE